MTVRREKRRDPKTYDVRRTKASSEPVYRDLLIQAYLQRMIDDRVSVTPGTSGTRSQIVRLTWPSLRRLSRISLFETPV